MCVSVFAALRLARDSEGWFSESESVYYMEEVSNKQRAVGRNASIDTRN